ncbi:HAD family hydrolase [Paenibacillus sp. GYB003]|uniref:HAD family hydrolase n=1 Tax=Paenibacillus sp. GYB003 TaxID=2994392 RepID=UPI002F962AE1
MMQTAALWDEPGHTLWKRDKYLRKLETRLNDVALVSLDVFDTLLFRATARPSDVFERTARKALKQGALARGMTPADYRAVRIAAERSARERKLSSSGSDEATLEQIFERLPARLGDRSRLLELELETERDVCWVNPYVASLVRHCRSRGIRVALLSDMYLSSAQLLSLLTAGGLETETLDAVLVSSEEGCGKRSGGLFDRLLRRFPDVGAGRIVHIGDNETADVLGAAKRGIEALHYPVVPDTLRSPFHWETVRHGDLLPELGSLRKLAAAAVPPGADGDEDGDTPESFFYRFGAGMLGPFVQGFCDWVLDTCAAEGRTEIHPLMREAHLLGPALENAARMRGLNISVKPLYVSRQATLLASMRDFTERELERVFGLGPITVGEALDMLGLLPEGEEAPIREFAPHLHVRIAEARSVEWPADGSGRTTLYDALKRYALREPVRRRALATIASQRKLLLDYIRQTCHEPGKLLTVDLGFNGTIQAALDAAYAGEGVSHVSIHLLAVASAHAAERLLQGIDLRGWLGSGGDNGDIAKRFARSPGLIEELMMGPFGSTVRYEKRADGRVAPALAPLAIPAEQFRFKRACQDGVFAFQRHYAYLRQAKPKLALSGGAREWCGVMHRVLDMPTPEEAAALGDLVHQDNFGGVQIVRLCEPLPIDWQSRGGDYLLDVAAFGPKLADIFWPQGTLTRSEPYRLYETFLRLGDSFGSAVLAFRLIARLTREGATAANLYGGGDFARRLQDEALLHGVRIARVIDPGSAADAEPAGDSEADSVPTALREAIAADDEAGHVYVIATLNDMDAYKRAIADAYGLLRPDVAPRLFEPLA